jgi:hypothetical protein
VTSLLKQISEEQQDYEKRGLPEISNRIMNIHYLVYGFMQDIIRSRSLTRILDPLQPAERQNAERECSQKY